MSRPLIASVLAVALALTSFSATPAVARNDDDFARFVAGAATIAIIGAIAQRARSDDHDKARKHRKYRPAPRARHRHRGHGARHDDRRGGRHFRQRRAALPSYCLSRYGTRRGRRELYNLRCMKRNFPGLRRLPHGCLVGVRTRHGIRRGYGALCLRRNGGWVAR